jgi:hypothetical protein
MVSPDGSRILTLSATMIRSWDLASAPEGSTDDVQAEVRKKTGLEPGPAGGARPMMPDAITSSSADNR